MKGTLADYNNSIPVIENFIKAGTVTGALETRKTDNAKYMCERNLNLTI